MSSTSTIATPGVSDGGTLWRGFILLPLGLLLYAVLPAGVLKTIVGIVMLIFDIGMMLVGVKATGGLTRGRPWLLRFGATVLVIIVIVAMNIASGLLDAAIHG